VLARRVPFDLWNAEIQVLQRPDKITFIDATYQFRQVRMNESHDRACDTFGVRRFLGHYEADTLVVDTVAVKLGASP
jgi:hypothetical protein